MSSRPKKKVKVTVRAHLKTDTQTAPFRNSKTDSQTPIFSAKETKRETTAGSDMLSRSTTKGKEREDNTQLPTSFKVVAGSYEKLLYGLDGAISIGDDSKLLFELKPVFIFPAHVSCIKAVAASPHGGKWLATGSSDEIIKVWDLRRRKEIGGLMHHEGSITHLVFPSRSHLLSASEDGSLCLFRARDWAVLRSLKGHKGHVNAVAVHPSGKVALSVGKDRALRMWDLMRGKGVASTKLGKDGEIVRWSSDGSKFGVQSGSNIQIYATNMDLLWTISHPSRIHDIKFVKLLGGDAEVLLVGAEDKKISVYHVPTDSSESPTILSQMVGHVNRVKAIQTLHVSLPPASGRTSTTIACTASSDGFINVYDMADISFPAQDQTIPKEIRPLTSYDSKGTRLTCLTLADGDPPEPVVSNGKRKRGEDAESEVDEDNEEDAWGGTENQEESLDEAEQENEGDLEEDDED